ncbi:uncharacterized protein [Anabrus simplex]|uniref:uncharacterized protein n=1 Tax=Anabrus simplex TaxID=316456 RepID=UPI0035A3A890
MSYCSVPGCKSGYGRKRDGRHCFKPPKETNLFAKWASVIPWKDKQLSTKSRICDLHFSSDLIVKTDSFVVNGENVELPRVRWKLTAGAVPHIFPDLPKYLPTEVKSQKSPSIGRNEDGSKRKRNRDHNVEGCLGITEEPRFIKSEPEWSPDSKEFLKWESEDHFLADNATSVKAETEHSTDAELIVNEGSRNSICESETRIMKEEIIKEEEEDINRRTDSFDLPASSFNVLQESVHTPYGNGK